MSNPGTIKGESQGSHIVWDDMASLHRSGDGGGVFGEFKAVRNGTLAELVRFVMSLPDADRPRYAIEKAGDHRLEIGEILALARRADFPGA